MIDYVGAVRQNETDGKAEWKDPRNFTNTNSAVRSHNIA